jgi:hypothetical protein
LMAQRCWLCSGAAGDSVSKQPCQLVLGRLCLVVGCVHMCNRTLSLRRKSQMTTAKHSS